MHAITDRYVETVKLLLRANADTSLPCPGERPLIALAAESGNVEIVRMLLDAGVDATVNFKLQGKYMNALSYASSPEMRDLFKNVGCIEIISTDEAIELLKRYEIINFNPFVDGVPDYLCDDVIEGSKKLLYEYGLYKDGRKELCDFEYVNCIYSLWINQDAKKMLPTECLSAFIVAGSGVKNALDFAVQSGHSEIVRLLLSTRRVGVFASHLYEAAGLNNALCLKLLLATPNINVNEEYCGTVPLYRAVRDGSPECVKWLLSTPGIDVNKEVSLNGETALYLAALMGKTKCVELLLATPGIDVNKADQRGRTPLCAAARNGHAECVRLLLSASDIDVNKVDGEGASPLYIASDSSHAECVKQLLTAPGIDVNKTNKYGDSSLCVAARKGHAECVKELLEAKGIDINKVGMYGHAPLIEGITNGKLESVKLLLAASDVDINKDSPLCHAVLCTSGSAAMVKLLLSVPGINVNKADKSGRTPLSYARSIGQSYIVEMLKSAGAKK